MWPNGSLGSAPAPATKIIINFFLAGSRISQNAQLG